MIGLLNFEIGEPLGERLPRLRYAVTFQVWQSGRFSEIPAPGLLAELVGDDDSFSEGDFRLLVIEANRSRG